MGHSRHSTFQATTDGASSDYEHVVGGNRKLDVLPGSKEEVLFALQDFTTDRNRNLSFQKELQKRVEHELGIHDPGQQQRVIDFTFDVQKQLLQEFREREHLPQANHSQYDDEANLFSTEMPCSPAWNDTAIVLPEWDPMWGSWGFDIDNEDMGANTTMSPPCHPGSVGISSYAAQDMQINHPDLIPSGHGSHEGIREGQAIHVPGFDAPLSRIIPPPRSGLPPLQLDFETPVANFTPASWPSPPVSTGGGAGSFRASPQSHGVSPCTTPPIVSPGSMSGLRIYSSYYASSKPATPRRLSGYASSMGSADSASAQRGGGVSAFKLDRLMPADPKYNCSYPGCTSGPFSTQYLLSSHANIHSSSRPYFCPVKGCPRGEGGKGFKRKNEMIRHGLVHDSPGYTCPFCPDCEHKYPRPDNLMRFVTAPSVLSYTEA